MKKLIIEKQTAGGRMDKAASKYLDKAPQGFIYKMLRKKNIVLNDQKATGKEILQDGDVITFYLADETIEKFRSARKTAPASQNKLAPYILYEDDNLIALNKPAGMLSQKSKPQDHSLNDLLTGYLQAEDLFTPGISNRLDRNTSGIVLAGKNSAAVRALNTAIKERQLAKYYLTVVKGIPDPEGTLEGYLQKDASSNKVIVYRRCPEAEKDSYVYCKSTYRLLDHTETSSLLMIDLVTGRSHQIRAQFAGAGYPLMGDPKYGDPVWNRRALAEWGVHNQLLHAWKIRFDSMEGILEYLNGTSILCPLPASFKKVLKGEHLCLHGVQEDSEVLNSKP